MLAYILMLLGECVAQPDLAKSVGAALAEQRFGSAGVVSQWHLDAQLMTRS